MIYINITFSLKALEENGHHFMYVFTHYFKCGLSHNITSLIEVLTYKILCNV